MLAVAIPASLVLGPCAYIGGLWPQVLSVTVDAPPGWRLVAVDDVEQNEALPTRPSKFLGIRPSGEEVSCTYEVSNGSERARCRVRALDDGCFKTGHQAWPRAVESLDGSLWLLGDWKVTAKPAIPGHAWFGCDAQGSSTLRVNGVESPQDNGHAVSLRADGKSWHVVEGNGWVVSLLADAGTTVHVAEWPRPKVATIRCNDSGFVRGALSVDGSSERTVALSSPMEVPGREFDLRLETQDGGRARVRLNWLSGSAVTLRVSR